MTALAWLIPCALLLGLLGLVAFLWSLRSGQFEDLEGAGWRALQDDERDDRALARRTIAHEIPAGVPGGVSDQRKRDHQPDEQRRDPERHEASDQRRP